MIELKKHTDKCRANGEIGDENGFEEVEEFEKVEKIEKIEKAENEKDIEEEKKAILKGRIQFLLEYGEKFTKQKRVNEAKKKANAKKI